jgi:hypothetical protein
MIHGWKTWLAIAGLVALAVVDAINGNIETALEKIGLALGLLGLGHKIEKAAK